MEKSIDLLAHSLVGIHSNTIDPGLVDTVCVDCHGQKVPIMHVAQTARLDVNSICIDPHDTAMVGAIVKCLKANGFSAYQFSKTRVIVSTPPISGETRQEVWKYLRKLGEDAKVAIRNIRKSYRKANKGEDKAVQKITDACITEIDRLVKSKMAKL